ncbi:hypothetical protein [Endozoicomonas sp. YOMI1]|uniref:hypothetical protein n=1 Tax=Endozoicomonas sp. YOMI1 TaxID=2828739 RepID=UPI0021491F7F|nr:hypothetical protein [Endozoicomonas sp. YOMI1]
MQAVGVNQVQQVAHEAVDNLPSSGVSRHIRAKARAFGKNVAVLCGVATVIGAYCLYRTEVARRLIMETNDKGDVVMYGLLVGAAVVLASQASVTISERLCTRPGGFIFERVCTMLDAYERQAAEVDTPVRPERSAGHH